MQRPSHFEQAARIAEQSERCRSRIDRLRTLAAGEHRDGYSRDTHRLDAHTWIALITLQAAGMGKRRHVSDYLAGCRRIARQDLLARGRAAELLAERVHDLVRRGEDYLVDVTGVEPDGEWPDGSTASALAAAIEGASWGSGATAQRELSRRHRADIFIH